MIVNSCQEGSRSSTNSGSPNQTLQSTEHARTAKESGQMTGFGAILAKAMAESLPEHSEVTRGLWKLMEAKDCFVRAELTRGK